MPKVKGAKKSGPSRGRPLGAKNKRKKPKPPREDSFVLIPKAQISCTDCNKKFKFKKNYFKHRREEHSKIKECYKCNDCSVRCPSKEILEKHITSKHGMKYYCEYCNKEFARYAHVLRHVAQTGCDGYGVNTYPCETCGAIFKRKDNLMVHLRQQHIFKKSFACKKNCSYSTRNFNKLIIHDQKTHTDKFALECDYCGKMAGSRAAMIKHLEIHGEKKYFCDVCGYQTHTLEVMRRHVFTHVKDKPHQCPECDRSFIQVSQLNKHLQRHARPTIRGTSVCDKCNIGFTSRALLQFHNLKVHRRLKKLICPVKTCSNKKEFSSMDKFEEHIKQHYGPTTDLSCDICNKTFCSESNLRLHVSTHTLERARRCMYCVQGRAFARGQQLVKHVRQAHNAVFTQHLAHVRKVMGNPSTSSRVQNSEMESVLMVLDAESERILSAYGEGVLYGGMLEVSDDPAHDNRPPEESPLMSEEELADNLNRLLSQLIDKETLQCLGWPDESVDTILEKVIEQCGARVADKQKWNRVQCLRENAKHLFLYVVEDKNIARMLDTHTIDQIVKHILAQVSQEDEETIDKTSIIPADQY